MTSTPPEKPRFPRAQAIAAAREILSFLITDRVIIAGSLRRRKPDVGDIEIIYIPKIEYLHDVEASDLFASRATATNLTDHSIVAMVNPNHPNLALSLIPQPSSLPILRPRENVLGSTTWGPKNKLALHLASGIPVDLFATTENAWWNYLVCRTGGSQNNIRIASAAQHKGWKWHPYGEGFTDGLGRLIPVTSEREVFELVGLAYLEPWQR